MKKFPAASWTAEWVRRFASAIREGREPEIGAREGWENLAFITAAYESLRIAKPVRIPAYEEVLIPCHS
jgi:predicted dehydrogenase